MSNIFDEDDKIFKPREKQDTPNITCDIFEPSVYAPDESRYRAEYIQSITAKIKFIIDTALLNIECPEGEQPSIDLETFGQDPDKTFKLIFKYLKGERGYNGSINNFVVLSDTEYNNLQNKDPNKFYFTYETDIIPDAIFENNTLKISGNITNNIVYLNGIINNNILNI